MICSNCNIRWAPLPEKWPTIKLTKEEQAKRAKVFDNNEIVYCPICSS